MCPPILRSCGAEETYEQLDRPALSLLQPTWSFDYGFATISLTEKARADSTKHPQSGGEAWALICVCCSSPRALPASRRLSAAGAAHEVAALTVWMQVPHVRYPLLRLRTCKTPISEESLAQALELGSDFLQARGASCALR